MQQLVERLERERGFRQQSVIDKCLLLGEEVGELFKAVRACQGLGIEDSADVGSVADELADILIYLGAIANRYGIDLHHAFSNKLERNKQRVWRQSI